MKKKVIVISLGGSLIVPKEINHKLISKFQKILRDNYKNYKFVVVCGGGEVARKYISILKKQKKSKESLSLAGIRATRMNAKLLMQIFGKESNDFLPKSMKEISQDLKKNKVVFCGALRFAPNETSDGTAAKLAHYFKTDFINLTNIKGLYNKNPLKHRDAKFIPETTWLALEKQTNKIKYQAGQHFVIDQKAASLIKKYKIRTYIIGPDLSNLNKLLNKKRFIGTKIEN